MPTTNRHRGACKTSRDFVRLSALPTSLSSAKCDASTYEMRVSSQRATDARNLFQAQIALREARPPEENWPMHSWVPELFPVFELPSPTGYTAQVGSRMARSQLCPSTGGIGPSPQIRFLSLFRHRDETWSISQRAKSCATAHRFAKGQESCLFMTRERVTKSIRSRKNLGRGFVEENSFSP